AKQAPYESGIVPDHEPSERVPKKIYLVARTFIVLDVEIIFLYPFTTIFRNFQRAAHGLAIMVMFLLTLLLPFAYLLQTSPLAGGRRRRGAGPTACRVPRGAARRATAGPAPAAGGRGEAGWWDARRPRSRPGRGGARIS